MRWRSAEPSRRAAATLAAIALAAAAPPSRIVSLNLCTDQLLLSLAPARILALSPLARDPTLSAMAAEARRYPTARPDAEAVLRLHPGLVIAGPYGARSTLALLRAQHIPVATFADPTDFPGIRTLWHEAGHLLHAEPEAEAQLAAMNQTLARPHPAHGSAILWEAHGLTAGPGTLGDAVLRAAGWHNAGTGGAIGIERMAAHPPDLLVVETAPRFPSLSTDLLHHPAVAALPRRTIPPAWLACGTPKAADAVAALAR